MKRPLLECADDRYFTDPVEVSKDDYTRTKKGGKLVIMLKKRPVKRFLRVNAPVDCYVGLGETHGPMGMLDSIALVEKKGADGRHTFLDFGEP